MSLLTESLSISKTIFSFLRMTPGKMCNQTPQVNLVIFCIYRKAVLERNYSLKKKRKKSNSWINLGPSCALAPSYTKIAARVTDALLSLLPPAIFHTRAMHKCNLYIQGRTYSNCALLISIKLCKVRFQRPLRAWNERILAVRYLSIKHQCRLHSSSPLGSWHDFAKWEVLCLRFDT